ncbi:hypothetical protein F5Y02DRAFT_425529 [Annulohypoxylon stygium]|nr:hypothetical protein F5Y02DRAFT_425529 [Annulohypoxylon stygium]
MALSTQNSSITAQINYLNPDPLYDAERPYAIASDPPPGLKRTNITQAAVKTKIHNARGKEDEFSLYSNGFQWVRHSLTYDVHVGQNVDRYMNDMGLFLQSQLKASRVVVYDFVIREQRGEKEPRAPGVPRIIKKQILGAHLDISRDSAIERIKLKCDDSEHLLQKRWHIVNIWRPLKDVVKSMPLALCDSRTLDKDDAVPSDIVLPHLKLVAYEIWYNPSQVWYYLKEQMPDEVLLMMSVDSETSTRCAHTAFEDPDTLPDDPKRSSIELRCMVFF